MRFGDRRFLLFDKGTDDVTYSVFSPPPFVQSKKGQMPSILILMLCILGAAFVFLCYLTILRRYRSNLSSRRRNTSPEDGTQQDFLDENHGSMVIHPIWYINTVGLQQSVIDSIAVFKYKKGEGLIEGTDCSVCLSEFEDDENLRRLPKCSHAFHIDCIDTWLRSHKNCPLCRAPIVCENVPETNETISVPNHSDPLEITTSPGGQPENDQSIDDDENGGQSENEEIKNPHSIVRDNGVRVLSDLADKRLRAVKEQEVQPVRRSISMDAPSASVIYAAIAKIQPVHEEGCSKSEEIKRKKIDSGKEFKPRDAKLIIDKPRKSFSFGRSLQKMPIRMKRSFSSSSSKSSFTRHSRNQQELVPTF
ncbi:hypothetical protein M9H77_19657 [Catharanthus roseus]|uniref:Uncharacterized protein n=1 Tax=Catharanthus roseus TaxID=4058 RepID=A0ACC0BB14_CATRO|nr:hypothetical protein M9H77_19657 [Catharanthus roseus]